MTWWNEKKAWGWTLKGWRHNQMGNEVDKSENIYPSTLIIQLPENGLRNCHKDDEDWRERGASEQRQEHISPCHVQSSSVVLFICISFHFPQLFFKVSPNLHHLVLGLIMLLAACQHVAAMLAPWHVCLSCSENQTHHRASMLLS